MEINVNNITLFYKKEGEGYPLILIHGSGEDHSIFDQLTEKLKSHFCVYAFDSRNHGKSSKTSDYTYDTMAKDFYQAIKQLDLKQPHLVGFSDGAIIGTVIETIHPNTFKKMALLGMNLHPDDFKDEVIQYMRDEYKENKNPLLNMMLTQPSLSTDQLSKIDTPSLIIFAEDDLFKPETIEKITSSLPNNRLKIIPNHDHGSYIINQNIITPDLIAFFNNNYHI